MLNLTSANVIKHRLSSDGNTKINRRSSAMSAIVNRAHHYCLICTGRGGIFSCQVDSNNSKSAATDTRMFPRWDWFDEMAMPLFIWLRGLKSPERITEVRISYLQWLSHEKEMHLLMYTHTNRAITSTHIYPDPCMQIYANITCSLYVPYRLFCVLHGWVVHRLTAGNPCTSASTAQCIIFTQSTNKTQ